MRIGERGMKLRPGSDDKPNHRQLRRHHAGSRRPGRAVAAVLRHRLGPLPLRPGRAERKLIVELAGRAAPAFLRRAVARRVSPQPPFRLPPRLPRVQRLRAGAHRGRPFPPYPLDPAGAQRQYRAQHWAMARSPGSSWRRARRRAIPPVLRLPALAPPRQRHGGDELRRLSQHGRGQRGAHRARRVPRAGGGARRGVADRPAR